MRQRLHEGEVKGRSSNQARISAFWEGNMCMDAGERGMLLQRAAFLRNHRRPNLAQVFPEQEESPINKTGCLSPRTRSLNA
eukprot:1159773-Pelagomonas_calceolata.AAC.4